MKKVGTKKSVGNKRTTNTHKTAKQSYEERTGHKSMFYEPPKDQHIADLISITGPGSAHDSVNKLREEYKHAKTHAKKTHIRESVNLVINRLDKVPANQNKEEKAEVRKIYKNFLDELEKDPKYREEQMHEREQYRREHN